MSLQRYECVVPRATDDDIPTVSMSSAYGAQLKPNTMLDFDYDAFRNTAERVHGTAMPLGKLAVQLVPAYYAKGEYNSFTSGDHRIAINTGALIDGDIKSPPKIQNTVQHELKHFSDKLNGNLERSGIGNFTYNAAQHMMSIRRMLTAAGATLGPGIAVNNAPELLIKLQAQGQLADIVTSLPWEHPVLYETATCAPALAAVAIGASALRYYLDPNEIRARRAGRAKHQTGHAIRTIPSETSAQ